MCIQALVGRFYSSFQEGLETSKKREFEKQEFEKQEFPMKGIIGRKVGMTQVFDQTGAVIPVTVIEAGPAIKGTAIGE